MRINKFLSTLGIASRRAIDKYIEELRKTLVTQLDEDTIVNVEF